MAPYMMDNGLRVKSKGRENLNLLMAFFTKADGRIIRGTVLVNTCLQGQ